MPTPLMDDTWPGRTLRRRSSRRTDDGATVGTTDAVSDFEFRPSRASTDESLTQDERRHRPRSRSRSRRLYDHDDDDAWIRREDGVWIRQASPSRRDRPEQIIFPSSGGGPSRGVRRRPSRQWEYCSPSDSDYRDYSYRDVCPSWPSPDSKTPSTAAGRAVGRAVRDLISSLGPSSVCNLFFAAYAAVAAASLLAGLLAEPGLGAGTYVAALGMLALAPLQNRHLQSCSCTPDARRRDDRARETLTSRRFERRISQLAEDLDDFRDEVFDTFDQGRPGTPSRRRKSGGGGINGFCGGPTFTVLGEEQTRLRRNPPRVSILRQDSNITLMSDSDDENCRQQKATQQRQQRQQQQQEGKTEKGSEAQTREAGHTEIIIRAPVSPKAPSVPDAGNDGFDDLKDEMMEKGKQK